MNWKSYSPTMTEQHCNAIGDDYCKNNNKLSINVEEGTENNREERISSVSRILGSSEFLNKNQKEEESREQLACSGNRTFTSQPRKIDKISNIKDKMEINCNEYYKSMKLLQFVADSQLTLTQVNGQRKLGPPPGWTGPPPGPKCEIFVGSIPRNYYEPEIVLIFSSVGTIYELRLMMDFSGTNRGYCFIMFTTEEEAARAIKELDQYEIYPGKRIGVVASINNCRLYINQLPRNIDSETITKRIYEITDDVDKVAVYRNLNGSVRYVLVSYKTHRGAAMGRRRLVPESATLFKNCEVNVEWANPNMIPSNVFEESGTCDQHGTVEMTKTFIEPVKAKKIVAQIKHKTDRRSNAPNNQRVQKSIDATIQWGQPIKAAKENSSKGPDRSSNQYMLEKCQLKHLVCSRCALMELARNEYKTKENHRQAWDINGNLRNTLLYNCIKHDQSNAILPSISSYLSKGKRLRHLKKNELRKSTESPFVALESIQMLAKNLSDPSCDLNKCKFDCLCRDRFRGESFHSRSSSSNLQSVESIIPKFSAALGIENANDGKIFERNVYRNEQQIPTESNTNHASIDFNNSSSANDTNRQLANCSQYANYQKFSNDPIEQSNRSSYVQLSDQTVGAQNARGQASFQSALNREHFSQQFLPNGVKSMMVGQNPGWCFFGPLPNEIYSQEHRKFAETFNGSSNNLKQSGNQMINPQNRYEIGFYENRANHGPFFNTPTSNFNERYPYENPMNPVAYSKNTVFTENRPPQFVENLKFREKIN